MIEQVMSNPVVSQLLITSLFRFFFLFGIVGVAVGIGLMATPLRMHQLFGVMNQWISLRHGTKWLTVPGNAVGIARRFRHLIGAAFIFLATFSLYVLTARIDVNALVKAIPLDVPPAFEAWLMDSVRWLLIVGNMLAIVVGIMLIFFPQALHRIETRLNHWYSTRSLCRGGEIMHEDFDRWVENYPRAAGGVIALGALAVVVDFGVLLFQHG